MSEIQQEVRVSLPVQTQLKILFNYLISREEWSYYVEDTALGIFFRNHEEDCKTLLKQRNIESFLKSKKFGSPMAKIYETRIKIAINITNHMINAFNRAANRDFNQEFPSEIDVEVFKRHYFRKKVL